MLTTNKKASNKRDVEKTLLEVSVSRRETIGQEPRECLGWLLHVHEVCQGGEIMESIKCRSEALSPVHPPRRLCNILIHIVVSVRVAAHRIDLFQ